MKKLTVRSKRSKVALLLVSSIVAIIILIVFLRTGFFDQQPESLMVLPNPVYLDERKSTEERVADLLSYMTLEEKIGQMALVEKDSLQKIEDIREYHLGALLSGSGSKPKDNTVEGWRMMIDRFQTEAKSTRLQIPLFYGSDAIHGHAHVPDATVFPHAIGLGATSNARLVKSIGEATASELRATGVNWNFAPNLDQPQDIRWGRVYEAFSDDPELVSKLSVAYLEGLQTKKRGEDSYVLGTAKHFLGLGTMGWGTSLNKNFKIDQGVTPADEALLRSRYLPPYAEIIDAGALSIMVGLNTWGEKRMVLQKELLTDVVKGELGFKGFLVSDWYGVHEGRNDIFMATVEAINAGVDMVMLPFDYQTFTEHMLLANRLGLISDERINDAVSRILYVKFEAGLFDEEKVGTKTNFSSPEHTALAQTAVAESLVLLKNEQDILPLSPNLPLIRVAGSAADNIGKQMGAWSIEWQGVDGNWVKGTSILSGIKDNVGPNTKVEFNELGNFSQTSRKASMGIAVVGEKPYAEGWGDKEYPTLNETDLQAIKNLQAHSEKVVVVIVSGRPLLIKNEIDRWEGLVAAWLPGSEGASVADVLFGNRPFVGTLPVPWPRHSEQLPISLDEKTADGTAVLFPRYYGRTTE